MTLFFKSRICQNALHVDARGYRNFVKQVPTGYTLDMSAWRKARIIPSGSKVPTEVSQLGFN